jgi:hypothetical protein
MDCVAALNPPILATNPCGIPINVDAGIIHERDACFLGLAKRRKPSDGSIRVLRLLPEKVGHYVVMGVDRQ